MSIVSSSEVKTILGISVSDISLDGFIDMLLPEVEADFLLIRGTPFEKDSDENNVYPSGSKLIAAQMIGWHLENRKSIGIDSKSLDGFSETKTKDLLNGYPKSVVGRIERFGRLL